jgi:hypothetical protein
MGWHRERRSAEGGAEQQERSVQRSLDVRKEHSYRSDDDSKSAGGAASVRQTPIGDQRALLSVGPAGMRAGTSIRDVRTAQTSWTGGLFHRSFFFLGKNCRAPAGVPHSRTLQPWHGCPAFGDRRILSAGIGSDLRAPFVLFASCIRAPPPPSLARSPFLRARAFALGRLVSRPYSRCTAFGHSGVAGANNNARAVARAFQIQC